MDEAGNYDHCRSFSATARLSFHTSNPSLYVFLQIRASTVSKIIRGSLSFYRNILTCKGRPAYFANADSLVVEAGNGGQSSLWALHTPH